MRKVLIDCGTHFGQGLQEFIDKFNVNEEWIVHTFEANPETYKKFVNEYWNNRQWIHHHNKAVSDHEGTITVNLETFANGDKNGMGSSVVDIQKWNPWNTEHREQFIQAEVPCINFSRFIIDNFNKEDFIVVKMDIEGSEFDVIPQLINTSAIDYIDHIAIEWHAHYFTNKEEMFVLQDELKRKISGCGVKVENWR